MDKKLKYLPKGKPNKEWFKNITDHYIKVAISDDIRDLKNIQNNYSLLNGVLNKDYFNKTLNPFDLPQTDNTIPVDEEVIPIISPSLNTLIGEIYERNVNFKAYVMNPTAVSEKEKWLKEEINKKLQNIVNSKLPKEEEKLRLAELKQWKEYDAQDVRERLANHILKDHIERLNFKKKSKEGWKELLYNSEQAYKIEIVKDNVVFEKLNPLGLTFYGLPNSGEIHKSEAIVYQRYMSVGEIITSYGNEINKKQLDSIIEKGGLNSKSENGIIMVMDKETNNDGLLDVDISSGTISYNSGIMNGKLLVKTVYFKVLRKVHDLYYIDEITGEEKVQTVSDDYEVNEEMGEHLENTSYINEYWQSTRIVDDIYVEQKECDVQMRDVNNDSLVIAPIIGIVMIKNDSVVKSVLDNLKAIQYQWTVYSKRLSKLWAQNLGKLVKLDISKIPKKYGFTVDLYMSWIQQMGIVVEDPFNEAMKGQPAGQFGSSVQAIDLELSSSISQALQYMIYLRELADEIVGVPRQRKGNLMASDGLGATQESINRSFKITEELFQEHYDLQKILLHAILEHAKVVLKSSTDKRMQYITDGESYALYDADTNILNDIDMGIFIDNTKKQLESEQTFMQLAHAYAQNGAIKMSEIMELYRTNSMSERINKLKLREKEQVLQQQQAEKRKQEHEQKLIELGQQFEQQKHEFEMQLQELKNRGIIEVARIQAEAKVEGENIKSDSNLEQAEIKEGTDYRKSDVDLHKAYLTQKQNTQRQQTKKQLKK